MTACVDDTAAIDVPISPTIPRTKEREAWMDPSLMTVQPSQPCRPVEDHCATISCRETLQVGERIVFKSVLGRYCPAVITSVHITCHESAYHERCSTCPVHYRLVYMDISLPVPAVVHCTYDVELRGNNILKSWQDSYWSQPFHRGRYSYMRQYTDDLTRSVVHAAAL